MPFGRCIPPPASRSPTWRRSARIDSGMHTLIVQSLSGGEPRQIGIFEFGLYLNWLPDESGIILSAGPFGTRQIFEVSLADGSVRVLADGDSPVLVP